MADLQEINDNISAVKYLLACVTIELMAVGIILAVIARG
jgi:hypothetical protein